MGARTITTIVAADATPHTAAFKKAGDDVRRYKREADDARKSIKSGGGLFGGLGKALREARLEERKSGGRQVGNLIGGSAIGQLGLGGLLIEKVSASFEHLGEAARNALKGTGTTAQAVDASIEAIPIFGDGYKIGTNLEKSFKNIRALWKQNHGATNKEVLAAMDEETRNEIQETSANSLRKELERTKAIKREASLIGLHGQALVDAQHKATLEQNKAEKEKLREDLDKDTFGDKALKEATFRTRSEQLDAKARAEDAERQRAHDESLNSVFRAGDDRISGIRAKIDESSLRTSGQEYQASQRAIIANYDAEVRALEEWARTNTQAFPEAAGRIRQYADETKNLYRQQAAQQAQQPLNDGLAAIRKQAEDSKIVASGGVSSIGLGIAELTRKSDGTFESFQRIQAAYKDLQQIAAAPIIGGVNEQFKAIKDLPTDLNAAQLAIAQTAQQLSKLGKSQAEIAAVSQKQQFTQDWQRANQQIQATKTPLEGLKEQLTEIEREKAAGLLSDEQYDRVKADAVQRAQSAIGPATRQQSAFSSEHSFTYTAAPQQFDLAKAFGINEQIKTINQRQLDQLLLLVQNKAVVLNISNLPGK